MENIIKKEVNVKGIMVECIQTSNEKIWVILNSLCKGLGIATNAQMERIKRDEDLLLKGVRILRIPSNGGEQDANCLELSFLPFFLTGIKAKMCKEEIRDNIVEFKLKAKDILAEAFLGKNNEKTEQFFDSLGLKADIKQIIEQSIQEATKPLNDKIINLQDMFNRKFKIYKNESTVFSNLLTQFCAKVYNIGIGGGKPYSLFYKAIEDWFAIKIPSKEWLEENYYKNAKDYILKVIGIDKLEMFVNGIVAGRIVLSINKHWTDLSGVYQNDIEWDNILKEFDYKCAYCGKENVDLVVEHLTPQSNKNSTNIRYNITCSCKECNESKSDKKLIDWYSKQEFYSKERIDKLKSHWNNYRLK